MYCKRSLKAVNTKQVYCWDVRSLYIILIDLVTTFRWQIFHLWIFDKCASIDFLYIFFSKGLSWFQKGHENEMILLEQISTRIIDLFRTTSITPEACSRICRPFELVHVTDLPPVVPECGHLGGDLHQLGGQHCRLPDFPHHWLGVASGTNKKLGAKRLNYDYLCP